MYQELNRRFARQQKIAVDVFDRPRVAVELPPGQGHRPEAVISFALAANLLSRIFARLSLVAPDVELPTNPWSLKTLQELQNPLSCISEGTVEWGTRAQPDIVLGIGARPTIKSTTSTFVTFSGWAAGLERDVLHAEPGVFGPLFAASYGAAQTFLLAAIAAGAPYRPINPFRISLLTYDDSPYLVPELASVDIGRVHLVGVGAVGSALIYALGHYPSLSGELTPIDNDIVDTTNLQRYVLMRTENVDEAKPIVAERALAGRGLVIAPFTDSFKEYAETNGCHFDLLLTPVDSEAGRRQLAMCLPKAVLNAATGNSTVTISRHGFGDGRSCLHCLYLPQVEEVTTEQRLATDLGIPVEEVISFLVANSPVDESLVRRAERHRCVPPGKFQDFVGKHIQSFYQHAVCGEAPVRGPNGTLNAPLSFISAAAGILLAAELVKTHTPVLRPFVLDNYFRLDTFFSPNPAFRECRRPDATRRCICGDRDYLDIYQEKYGT